MRCGLVARGGSINNPRRAVKQAAQHAAAPPRHPPHRAVTAGRRNCTHRQQLAFPERIAHHEGMPSMPRWRLGGPHSGRSACGLEGRPTRLTGLSCGILRLESNCGHSHMAACSQLAQFALPVPMRVFATAIVRWLFRNNSPHLGAARRGRGFVASERCRRCRRCCSCSLPRCRTANTHSASRGGTDTPRHDERPRR